MELSLGFSPCPNDCFIFEALVNGRIDTGGIVFRPTLADVENLNQRALRLEMDVTKLSFHAFAHVSEQYILLRSGSALGFNCGPILISARNISDPEAEIRSVAIPGKYTTANFLLSLAYPRIHDKREMLFSDIEDAVMRGEVDAGLIIHESRFTFESKGLFKVRDLGEFWDELIQAPIPLGGIAIKRSLPHGVLHHVNRLIRESLQFAFDNPSVVMPYVREHAQEMDEDVMKKHIDLYVNDFSLDLGETGEKAVNLMFAEAEKKELFSSSSGALILPPD
jgi:1,4-dihydroxy-6-naphthoate synthase